MSAKVPAPLCRKLEKAARLAAKASYSPYSKFRVGAAVLAGSGKIYRGTNVENASYGLCNCAERTAIFTAIASGESVVRAVAVYTPTQSATAPCGACRQVINEFGPDALVISTCDSDERTETTLDHLLPAAFGPGDLQGRKNPDLSDCHQDLTNTLGVGCNSTRKPKPALITGS